MDEVVKHCRECGHHWVVDDYDVDYDLECPICESKDVERCEDEKCALSEAESEMVYQYSSPSSSIDKNAIDAEAVYPFLVEMTPYSAKGKNKGKFDVSGKWNRDKNPGFGKISSDGNYYIAYGISTDDKGKHDGRTALYIVSNGQLRAGAGGTYGTETPASTLSVFKDAPCTKEFHGMRANASDYPEVIELFTEFNEDHGWETVIAPDVDKMLESFGKDVERRDKIHTPTKVQRLTDDLESALKRIEELEKAKKKGKKDDE